jgi:serine/threonine-protein kinase ATR
LDKPQDDLRKDSRLLECTSLINRLLKKDAESRKRNLRKTPLVQDWATNTLTLSADIRTYTVIPLHEACGLIEWVPDTAGVRHLMIKCYEPKGIPAWVSLFFRLHCDQDLLLKRVVFQSDELKKVYDGIKNQQRGSDPVACGKVFSEQVLPKFPPVFHEWFLDNFPEPTAWLKARTAFGRTAAVMSMVGFVLGSVGLVLADRPNG